MSFSPLLGSTRLAAIRPTARVASAALTAALATSALAAGASPAAASTAGPTPSASASASPSGSPSAGPSAGPSAPSASASASPSPSAASAAPFRAVAVTGSWPTLRTGSSGVDVRTAQHLLREADSLASPIGDGSSLVADGRFGRATRHAVVEFQRRYELRADGVIGRATWEALVVTVGPASRSEAVLGLQHQLRAIGHRVTADGVYGRRTTAAVTALQRSARLPVDGIAGTATWRTALVRSRG